MTPPRHASRRSDDRGQVTIWMLAFSLTLLMLGLGVSIEIWRVVTAWRSLASTADAAATSGASGIDDTAFRDSGGITVRLDPALAEDLAYQSLETQADRSDITSYQAAATTEEVTVVVQGHVDLLLLGTLRDEPLAFTVTATAEPRISP
jgi:Flp pilus assembly protein TadG